MDKTKNPGKPGFMVILQAGERLLDFAFFIHDVLTHHRIILFHFQLVGRGSLVLVSRIEVAGAR
jgi:hypothetical protein